MTKASRVDQLLALIREGQPMTLRQQLQLTVYLSIPSILAQLSSIVMQYVDAAMVGSLGADASASIGLVSTTNWLFWGVSAAAVTGFSVQVAHRIGAGDFVGARKVLRQSFTASIAFSALLALIGCAISGALPGWLGGTEAISADATLYFLVQSLFLPIIQLNYLSGGMLRCSGNMHIPSMLNIWMCVLDVVFNFFLIFPTRSCEVLGWEVVIPGAGWGVLGAAYGTVLAEMVIAGVMTWYLCRRSPVLKLVGENGSFLPTREVLRKALRISLPMGLEHGVMCTAQILITAIVAPLGVFAIAANSFAITAESLCYMPGYGIAEAATTLIGQSLGAGRKALIKSFANITVWSGMIVMGLMGVVMYVFAPQIIGLMTPIAEIRNLGVMALRIEAFAEPMFAAAIVTYGVFVGMGRTLVPCLTNFISIWGIRLTLATLLAPTMGLNGVWLAMCIELCLRGAAFLFQIWRGSWQKHV